MNKWVLKLYESSSLFYYIAFILYFLFTWIERINLDADSTIALIKNVLRLSIIALLLLKYFLLDINWKGYVLTACLAFGGLLTWRISGEGWLFWLILFVITAQFISYRKLALISIVQSGTLLILVPTLYLVGLINDKRITDKGIIRSSLGFMHPNHFGLLILIFCVSLVVILFKEKVWLSISVIVILTTINYFVSHSRSSAISTTFLIFLLLIFKFISNEKVQRLLSYFMVGCVVFCIGLSYFSMVYYSSDSSLWNALNRLLSGRISLAHRYFEMHPLTLLGRDYSGDRPIAWTFDGIARDFLVDNVYAHLLLRYGVLPTLVLLGGYVAVLIKLIQRSCWNEVFLALVLFAVYGLTETFGIRVESNYMIVALGIELIFASSLLTQRGKGLKLCRKEAA